MAEETLEQKAARLEQENADLKTKNADLDTQKNELQAKHDKLEKDSGDIIGDLSKRLNKAEKKADKVAPSITVGKESYRILGSSFTFKGKEYTVEQLKKDKDLQEQLVEIGAGFLVKE